jgi:hypothetical protein
MSINVELRGIGVPHGSPVTLRGPAGPARGLTSTDAIGVLAVDATGKLKEEKVGARSTGKGAGVGASVTAAVGALLSGAGSGTPRTTGDCHGRRTESASLSPDKRIVPGPRALLTVVVCC